MRKAVRRAIENNWQNVKKAKEARQQASGKEATENTFRAFYNIHRVGIFDYKAHKLVWESEVISKEEFHKTRNHLVPPQPWYMSGNKLYIKDSRDTLHIFERVNE